MVENDPFGKPDPDFLAFRIETELAEGLSAALRATPRRKNNPFFGQASPTAIMRRRDSCLLLAFRMVSVPAALIAAWVRNT